MLINIINVSCAEVECRATEQVVMTFTNLIFVNPLQCRDNLTNRVCSSGRLFNKNIIFIIYIYYLLYIIFLYSYLTLKLTLTINSTDHRNYLSLYRNKSVRRL